MESAISNYREYSICAGLLQCGYDTKAVPLKLPLIILGQRRYENDIDINNINKKYVNNCLRSQTSMETYIFTIKNGIAIPQINSEKKITYFLRVNYNQ